MKCIFYLAICAIVLSGANTMAQTDSRLDFVGRFVDQWTGLRSIHFEEDVYEKALFSEDTVRRFYSTDIVFDSNGETSGQRERVKSADFDELSLYDGHRRYFLHANKTYDIAKEGELLYRFGGNLFAKGGIIETLKNYLHAHPLQITVLPDTLIDRVACHYIKMTRLDTAASHSGGYDYTYLAFDKQAYHPKYFKTMIRTELSKGGISLGTVDVFTETVYANVVKNGDQLRAHDFAPPANYSLAADVVQDLLKKGAPNPEWTATALDGKVYNASSFRGRPTLLFLTVIDCPANQLSLQTIKNLQKTFDQDQLQVVAVYSDKADRVEKYVKTNSVRFPVVADGKSIKASYAAEGSPYYYLIDRNGFVYHGSFGYNDAVEKQLTDMIRAMGE